MKITALIENKATGDLVGEHGLSIHVTFDNKEFLLDSGASNKFVSNADKLGIELSKIDAAVLSHSHYDHSGGYRLFFSRNDKASLYLQSKAEEGCYVKYGPIKIYIGIPKYIFKDFRERLIFVDDNLQIAKDVWLITHKKGYQEKGLNARMYRKTESGLYPDDFLHEQSLVFNTKEGLVILNSCCHIGVDHIVEEVIEQLPGKDILAMVGGFHLMGNRGVKSMSGTKEEIRALGQRLLDLNVKNIYTCHCTGHPAFEVLKEVLKERLFYFSTGTVVEL